MATNSNLTIVESAKNKRDWILDWIRSERERGFRSIRSRKPSLAELEG